MKVLQINSVCGRGSTGRIATDLADVLSERGHDCRIAYGRGTVPERYQNIAVRIGTDWDVRLHGIKTRLFDLHGFGSRAATRKFLNWVREYDPDVIHLHNIHGYYINIELLFEYLKKAGKPVIWTLHDCWAFTGHCSYFSAVGCEQWKIRCESCIQQGKYPKCLGKGNVARNFERKKSSFMGVPNLKIVTPSSWLADLVKESFLKEYPVEVIRNGIDLNVFKPTKSNFREEHGLIDKRIILGVASVWDERKGFEDFIALSKLLDDHHKIVLVGLDRCQINILSGDILGITRTDSTKELAEIYSTADVFLNPTYEDNFPTTNLEALACGTPVITYRTGGSVEAICSNCGDIIDVGDVGGLAELIPCMQKKGNHCIDRAKMFDKKQRYLEYIAQYEG